MYRHILLPLDGSEIAEQVLPHAEALAGKFAARITLLRVTTAPEALMAGTAPSTLPLAASPPLDPTPIIEAERNDAADYLARMVARLREQGLEAASEVVEGDVAETIVARARHLNTDLITMSTHGRGGLERLAFGSVADKVLRTAPCPVLLVRVRV